MAITTRIWDLPTRLFHWSLALCVPALVITAKIGGNAMEWHLRLGYVTLALLTFRILWGFFGGYWSRFSSFLYSPAHIWRYLRGQSTARDHAGHNPLGSLSVFGLLGILLTQIGTGLIADDEISSTGPLARFVSSDTVSQATGYHTSIGQYAIYAVVALHIAAIAFYTFIKRKSLIGAMVGGDKALDTREIPAKDGVTQRLVALVLACASGGLAWWFMSLGTP